MRVAAIDCGTNSIRLLVADGAADGTGPLRDVVRRMEVVRLGHGVDATGVIAPGPMARTLAMTREYARVCDELDVEAVRFVATSASRDAANAGEFADGVRAAFGRREVSPEVLTGLEEARLSFLGATGDVAATGAAAPYLVVDLGGGSTEFVRGATAMEAACSVDMGCVRMTERYLRDDPPSAAQLAAARAGIGQLLDQAGERAAFDGIGTLVGLAGTVTTVTAHALRLPRYDPEAIHLSARPVPQVLAACDDLITAPREARAALPFMHPGRVDVIAAGALVWASIVRRVAERSGIGHVLTCEHDILDGIALSLLRHPEP